MNKIFQIITSINLGGAENVVFNLIENYKFDEDTKNEFVVVELFPTKSFYSLRKKNELKARGIRVITLSISKSKISLVFASFRLLFYLLKERPKCVHSHTDLPDFVLSLTLKFYKGSKFKIIRTIHNTKLWSEHIGLGKFVESSFKKDLIVGVSKAALNAYVDLRRMYRLPASQSCTVIYNGCKVFGKEAHHFQINSNKINIAFCGRFVTQKGLDYLVRYLNELDEEISKKIIIHFIGDGPLKDSIIELMKNKTFIKLYSTVGRLSQKIYDFDFLIVPSEFEGLGLISVESSLAHVPVIATKVPGLEETLPSDWPLFFDFFDAQQLNVILQNIVNLNYDLSSLKKQAFDYAIDKFSMDNMVKRYSELYSN